MTLELAAWPQRRLTGYPLGICKRETSAYRRSAQQARQKKQKIKPVAVAFQPTLAVEPGAFDSQAMTLSIGPSGGAPSPHALLARLLTFATTLDWIAGLAERALQLLLVLAPQIHPALPRLWANHVPKLIDYLRNCAPALCNQQCKTFEYVFSRARPNDSACSLKPPGRRYMCESASSVTARPCVPSSSIGGGGTCADGSRHGAHCRSCAAS